MKYEVEAIKVNEENAITENWVICEFGEKKDAIELAKRTANGETDLNIAIRDYTDVVVNDEDEEIADFEIIAGKEIVEFENNEYVLEQEPYYASGSGNYEALAHRRNHKHDYVMLVWNIVKPEAEMDEVCDWDRPSDIYETSVD